MGSRTGKLSGSGRVLHRVRVTLGGGTGSGNAECGFGVLDELFDLEPFQESLDGSSNLSVRGFLRFKLFLGELQSSFADSMLSTDRFD